MKRSEMLDIIKKQWVQSTSFPTDEAVAIYILDAIEKAGMLAPLALVNDSPYPPGHKWHGTNKVLENKWEPENET